MGAGLCRRRVGTPAGPRVRQQHLRLAACRSSRLTGLALLIGLPIALVLAWYHGDRGQQQVTRTELAILTLLFLLGGGIFWYFERASERHRWRAPRQRSPHLRRSRLPAPDANRSRCCPSWTCRRTRIRSTSPTASRRSCSTCLRRCPSCKVIARTSSFAFKGKKVDIAEIAKKLNVAHVLEGSVRKSGEQAAHHRAAHPRRRQLAPVVRDLRPHARATSSRCRTRSPARSCRRCRSI